MRLKTYNPACLISGTTAETAGSLVPKKALSSLPTATTSLTQDQVAQAISFIKNTHGLVVRKSLELYYTHPMATAKILREVTHNSDTMLAGLLHDIVEDTPITLPQISLMYGPLVAHTVNKVTAYPTNGYCL